MPYQTLIIPASQGRNFELANLLKTRFPTPMILDLHDLNMPMYSMAREEAKQWPHNITTVAELFDQAEQLVWCVPEYNGGIPPVVTNLVAWLSRWNTHNWRASFVDKPTTLATVSGGRGDKVLPSLRQQFSHCGMVIVDEIQGKDLLD